MVRREGEGAYGASTGVCRLVYLWLRVSRPDWRLPGAPTSPAPVPSLPSPCRGDRPLCVGPRDQPRPRPALGPHPGGPSAHARPSPPGAALPVHPLPPSPCGGSQVPSEDPLVNGAFAVAFTRGMQVSAAIFSSGCSCTKHLVTHPLWGPVQEGDDPRYLLAATTLKHFAAYSLVRRQRERRRLRTVYPRSPALLSSSPAGRLPRAACCAAHRFRAH